jgi:hypothetical protein
MEEIFGDGRNIKTTEKILRNFFGGLKNLIFSPNLKIGKKKNGEKIGKILKPWKIFREISKCEIFSTILLLLRNPPGN